MDMIKKLHRKFILVATLAVCIIVVVALGVINGTLYLAMRNDIHNMLVYISDNGGIVTSERKPSSQGWLSDGNWTDDTPEFTYQTRYFSVLLDNDGTAKVTNVNHIAAFTAKEAVATAVTAVKTGQQEGFFKKDRASYAYYVSQNEADDFLVVIMDCTRDFYAINVFLKYSVMFGLVCILLFVCIVTVFCRKVMRPFVRNVENQKRFITNASHELKTPVAIISANAEAMELINGKNEWTGNILAQVKRLSLLINDMVLLSKIGEGASKDIVLEQTDLSLLTQNSVSGFKQMIQDQGKTLATDIEASVQATAEPKLFGEIVSILLDNAAKYCDDKGTITVALQQKKNKKGAILSVSNTYKAGRDVDYEQFFERFYRGDTSHNSKKAGYGIGLSMAKDMAKLMKGKMTVSYEGETITFNVLLEK